MGRMGVLQECTEVRHYKPGVNSSTRAAILRRTALAVKKRRGEASLN
jgi:hypothetical protein